MNRRQRAKRRYIRACLELDFRGLRGVKWRLTSKRTNRYNCFAWAIGENHRRIDVINGHWPNDLPRDDSIETLVRVFMAKGYSVCTEEQGRSFDPGFNTIVLYNQDRLVDLGQSTERIIHEGTHAAKLLPNGTWSSKLGPDEDISHPTPEAIGGPCYGEPLIFMRKARKRHAKEARKSSR